MALKERWRLAVGHEPPGGLSLFRQVVLADTPGGCATGYKLCVLLLIDNDIMLGSGDAVP